MALADFIHKLEKMKHIQRKGWLLRGVKDVESVADHTYRVSLLASLVSDTLGLDTEKVVKMALIHDLPEAYIGDITPHDVAFMKKEELEKYTVEHLFDEIGDLNEKYKLILKEYLEQKTDEAHLVYQADKLEMAYQAYEYEIKQKMDLTEFFEDVKTKIDVPILVELFTELVKKRKIRM